MPVTRARIALLALALLGGGCAAVQGDSPRQVQVVERVSEIDGIVGYAHWVSTMNSEAQRAEFAAASQAFATLSNPETRLRLAVLLSTPGAPFQDDAKAVALLAPLADSDVASPPQQFATVLRDQISARLRERRRTEAERGRTEAAEKRLETEQARAEAERRRADALKAELDAARTQLEALKAVERSIIERGQAQKARPR